MGLEKLSVRVNCVQEAAHSNHWMLDCLADNIPGTGVAATVLEI